MPGVASAIDVLKALVETIIVESAIVMVPPDGAPQPIHKEFCALLPAGIELRREQRYEFYESVKSPQTALVIATGEQRRFANLLLTIGVVKYKSP